MPSKGTVTATPELLKLQKSLCRGRSVIGIDIGFGSVGVAQTAVLRGKPTLVKVAVERIDLAPGQDRDNATIAALKRVLSKFNTKKAQIVCVLPSRQTMVENIVMPLMPQEELFDAVNLEVTSSKRFVVENPILDFQVAGRTIDNDVEKMNVTVAVVARHAVDNLLAKFIPRKAKPLAGTEKIFQREDPVGLGVDAIIPVSVAIENIIKRSKLRIDETLAIIEMGSMATELNIYRNSQLEFSRQISVNGFNLCRSLMNSFFTDNGKVELTQAEAEHIRDEYGIPSPQDDYLVAGKISAAQILSLLRPVLEQFSEEIRRSFDYYHEKTHVGKVDRIIIFGSGAKIKGLVEFLGGEFGLSVYLGNPLQDVELLFDGVLENQNDAPRLAQAIGAALSDLQGINLLPAQLKDRKKKDLERVLTGVFIVLMAGIWGFICFGFLKERTLAREQAVRAQHEYQELLPQLKELEQGLLLQRAIRNRPDLGGLLKQLSTLPSNIYLTQVDLHQGTVHLSGFVVGKESDVQEVPDQLLVQLQGEFLHNAALVSRPKMLQDPNVLEFKIKGSIYPDGESR